MLKATLKLLILSRQLLSSKQHIYVINIECNEYNNKKI